MSVASKPCWVPKSSAVAWAPSWSSTTVSAEAVMVLSALPIAVSSPPAFRSSTSLIPAESCREARAAASPLLVAAEALIVVAAVAVRPALEFTSIILALFRPKLLSTKARLALSSLTFVEFAVDLAVDVAEMVASESILTPPRLFRPAALTVSTEIAAPSN